MTDPIICTIKLALRRGAIYAALGLGLGSVLWITTLVKGFDAGLGDLVPWTEQTYHGGAVYVATALFWGCYLLSFAAVTLVYLMLSMWWGGRVEALHRRGPRRGEDQ